MPDFADHEFLERGLMILLWAAAVVAVTVLVARQPSLAGRRIDLVVGNGACPNLGVPKEPTQRSQIDGQDIAVS